MFLAFLRGGFSPVSNISKLNYNSIRKEYLHENPARTNVAFSLNTASYLVFQFIQITILRFEGTGVGGIGKEEGRCACDHVTKVEPN